MGGRNRHLAEYTHPCLGDLGICIRRAIARGADWPDIHCLAGEWLARAGRSNEAKKHFTRAMQLKSPYPRAARGMAAMAA